MATNTATRKKARRVTTPANLPPTEPEQPQADTTPADQPPTEPEQPQADTTPADQPPTEPEQEDDEDDVPELPGDYKALRVSRILPNPKNVRTNAQALPGIVQNLEEDGIRGLLAPLIVIPYGTHRGKPRYLAVDGEQRYWSAVDAKQKFVQAIIRQDLAGNVDQIVSMLRQIHRTDPTAQQLAQGVEQLALYGLDDDEINRRTGYGIERVKAARAVAKLSGAVSQRAQQSGLDLTQQAILSKFADVPETVDKLLDEAEKGPFAFSRAVEEARATREREAAVEHRRAELIAAGVKVFTDRVDSTDLTIKRLDMLLTEDGKYISDDDHAACPGHTVAVYHPSYSTRMVEITYCADWKANGHTTPASSTGTLTRSGPMTEEQKAERREVIENNRAMEAANTVRREWVTNLLAGTAEPKGSKKFIAQELAEPGYLLGTWINQGRKLLDDLLTPGKAKRPGAKRVPARTSEIRYTMITLASVVAAHESAITRTTWRSKDESAARYLQWCTLNGYEPGKVERLIIDAAGSTSAVTRPALALVAADERAAEDASTQEPVEAEDQPTAEPEPVADDQTLPVAA
ncbi:ParB N-terminal domain-containing protein [Actinoplanes sp. CA-030573]|uniref:ParB/RepB/Spo0J family partition protein n=1 Tax=Actinoplanes sp. CA-030573 TaxID=3239898 RepID=UPI003D8FEFCC